MATMPLPTDATASSSDVSSRVDEILQRAREEAVKLRLPEATYRVQFNRTFTFRDAANLASYLATLGITDCYASPYLRTREGSMHGYDVVDHSSLNRELGTEEDYHTFVSRLAEHGLGHILDVVPNHMGIGMHNPWWMDVLENGPSAAHASYFDIDWMPLKPDLGNKVLLPILGDQYGAVLEEQQLVLNFEHGEFVLTYFDQRLPIAPRTWGSVLRHRIEELETRLGAENTDMLEYHSILSAIGHLPSSTETDSEKINEGRREREVIKRRLSRLCETSSPVREFVQQNVQIFNGTKGDPHSFDSLDQLLQQQSYRLAFWRVAADEINYRRFFDINELAAICMENPEVFSSAHGLTFRLIEEGKLNGLRIDHPDGLFDPVEYLHRLQFSRFLQLCRRAVRDIMPELETPSGNGQKNGGKSAEGTSAWNSLETALRQRYDSLHQTERQAAIAHPLYVVVEKILEPEERLPENWPVHGTTGYDFLTALNGIFVDRSAARAFDNIYARFIKQRPDFRELVYDSKKLIMQASMSSEISVLGHQLDRISEQNRASRDFTLNSLTETIREIIACFPVYRTYIDNGRVLERDRRYVERAVAQAKRRNPATSASVFDFVRDSLLLRYPREAGDAIQNAQRRFVGKFQQVTSVIMAKGVEDTAFYLYNRLVSLNEVGGDPEIFGIPMSEFHAHNQHRQKRWPYSMLATSTHDTKRSEDVRARINVISEMPKPWNSHIFRWTRWNQRKKSKIDGELCPTRNDEYLLYQTLVGTWPLESLDTEGRGRYIERIQQYMIKAIREAKAHTSWISPQEPYERAMLDFISSILEDDPRNRFLKDFQPFAERVSEHGIWNSLSQTLLKFTCPGVPDIYQGAELWVFQLVDPDNRGAVDYAVRRKAVEELDRHTASGDLVGLAQSLVAKRTDGLIKLHIVRRCLGVRRKYPGLFTRGAYVPLEATGAKKDHLFAFLRRDDAGHAAIAVAPRLTVGLGGAPIGSEVWSDCSLSLPADAPKRFQNVFTGETLSGESGSIPVASLLSHFPVALLEAKT